eukprot:g2373.t1
MGVFAGSLCSVLIVIFLVLFAVDIADERHSKAEVYLALCIAPAFALLRKDNEEERKKNQIDEEDFLAGKHSYKKTHFGLHWILRDWVSLALRRESFLLLAKASALAIRYKIKMDKSITEIAKTALNNTKKAAEGKISALMRGLPNDLKKILRLDSDRGNVAFGNRCILFRFCERGLSPIFAGSPCFERDVASTAEMNKTFEKNKQSVLSSVLGTQKDLVKSLNALNLQIVYHNTPGKELLLSSTEVTLRRKREDGTDRRETLSVKLEVCLSFENHAVPVLAFEFTEMENTTKNESTNEDVSSQKQVMDRDDNLATELPLRMVLFPEKCSGADRDDVMFLEMAGQGELMSLFEDGHGTHGNFSERRTAGLDFFAVGT